jgi:hypothetical protein
MQPALRAAGRTKFLVSTLEKIAAAINTPCRLMSASRLTI